MVLQPDAERRGGKGARRAARAWLAGALIACSGGAPDSGVPERGGHSGGGDASGVAADAGQQEETGGEITGDANLVDGSEEEEVGADSDISDAAFSDDSEGEGGPSDVAGEPEACVPTCRDRECGDDGCGSVCGRCESGFDCLDGLCVDEDPALPELLNRSGVSDARARALAEEALAGLGFDGRPDGPRPEDRVFVGSHYIAWLDETGFYGKMNGLWWLNGAAGDALDFAVRDTRGRPFNLLVPGEDGDGRWPAGYPGAEHIEFPSRVPETNDNPDCASRDWCNQYALDEAAEITDRDIPWWSACNAGDAEWLDRFEPVEVTDLGASIRILWEGRLVKEADGDGRRDGDACHQDWLFADGVRRAVFLRVGYELYPDQPHVDRLMQLRNPAGNPTFDGPMSLIGGFVMSDWPEPHYLKALHRNVWMESRAVEDTYHGLTLGAGVWTAWPSDPVGRDVVFAWLGQAFALSPFDAFSTGLTARMDHNGPSDNDDAGFCLCEVHGGIEIGGGLIHGGVSLPLAPGASSVEARRRLAFGGDDWSPVARRVYESEAVSWHGSGRAEGDGWSATPSSDAAGHILYGPYATDWGGGAVTAVFDLLVDEVGSRDTDVVTIDLFDSTADEILVTRTVRRSDFDAAMAYESFALEGDLRGRGGHTMEARVYWHDHAYARIDRVTVFGGR